MPRTAVVHPLNEQPFLVDLLEDPTPTDVNLICANPRALDGRRLVYIDDPNATFVFPYLQIRFLELRVEGAAGQPAAGGAEDQRRAPGEPPAADEDLEIDEDFLRRIREA